MPAAAEPKRRFRRITTAGIFFQGGAAAVDTSTIVAALVHGLTGSAMAVGAAAAIARYGWLFPQLIVGWLAQRRSRRLPFYMFGAFGRVLCLAGVATLVALAGDSAGTFAIAGFFVLWTIYAFVSGVVAVPYNDIVARSIESGKRSRMLALRFFGGGLLALGVAAIAGRLLEVLTFSEGYAAILIVGALLLLISTLSFVSAGEPQTPLPAEHTGGFVEFLKSGVEVFRRAAFQRAVGPGSPVTHRWRGSGERDLLRRRLRDERRSGPAAVLSCSPSAQCPDKGELPVKQTRLRRWLTKSWVLSGLYYRLHGIPLTGRPADEVWYFAFGANMHDSAFRERRGMHPLEWRPGRIQGYRLRFNLEGRPKGRAAPANIALDPDAEVWGVLYKITRRDSLRLDASEGVPGPRYWPIWLEAEDVKGNRIQAVAYIAEGKARDGNPSLRYLTMLREGARTHGLPEQWLHYLDNVKPAE